MTNKQIIYPSTEELSDLQPELELLMNVLEVEPEIREGTYSDDSIIGDLFDMTWSREEIIARLATLDLPAISPGERLVDVLREMRKLTRLQ